MLDEQQDLNKKLMDIENERMKSALDLLHSKMEVTKQFSETKEIYRNMMDTSQQLAEGKGVRPSASDGVGRLNNAQILAY